MLSASPAPTDVARAVASISVGSPASASIEPKNPPAIVPAEVKEPARTPLAMGEDFFALFVSDLEQMNPRLAAALEHASFVQADSKISFYVPDTYFGMIKLDQKGYADLEGLLQKKLGVALKAEIHRGKAPVEKEAEKVGTPETLVENDPIVKEFVKTFKGKISRIELNKERNS